MFKRLFKTLAVFGTAASLATAGAVTASTSASAADFGSAPGNEKPKPAPKAPAKKHAKNKKQLVAEKRKGIIKEAHKGIGVKYRSGGTTRKGWDCSGFVRHTYAKQGIKLPRTSSAQARAGKKLSLKNAQPGDIVWRRGHVGIVVDPKRKIMIDAGNRRVNTVKRSYKWMGSGAKAIRVRSLEV